MDIIKYLWTTFFFSPYKVLYLFGFINGIIIFIVCLVSTYIPCSNNYYCLVEYNNEYYFDNIKNFFNYDLSEIILFSLFTIIFSNIKLLIIMIIQDYTLCHSFLPYKILYLITDINLSNLTKINKAFGLIFSICYFILDLFFILVFLEIIELNFCGLNRNLKTNIMDRAIVDRKESECIIDEDDSFINDDDDNYIIEIKGQKIDGDKQRNKKKLGIEMEGVKN